ncbi:hypothetical protein Ddc_15232 [Ditylenchus destructor]|nr:hypothetical protein Ddc_15232 [Ditylenchus destructor]
MLPNYVLLDVLKCMRRKGLAKIQGTDQLINEFIKRDFASKPLHIFDDHTVDPTIRRNENNELLFRFTRGPTESTNAKCFVPSIQELQDCEGECCHYYPIEEMRPFMAKYIRYTKVWIYIDNVDNSLPPYTPEQITVLESISHIWTGQTLMISDLFEDSVDYNLKEMLGNSAILQCHSLSLSKAAIEDEIKSDIITELEQCAYLYTIPVIYFSCPILENDIEFLTSSVPCSLRVIIEILLSGSSSLVQYDSLASSEREFFQFRLENNRTKEVLQLKQITKQEAKEKFNVVLYQDEEDDSFTEGTDGKALILERFTV